MFYISGRRARVLVISAWLISIIFSIPVIFLFEEKPVQGTFLYFYSIPDKILNTIPINKYFKIIIF